MHIPIQPGQSTSNRITEKKVEGGERKKRRDKTGTRCVVMFCSSTIYDGVSLHAMPGPMPSWRWMPFTPLQMQWIDFIQSTRIFYPYEYKRIHVCALHFSEEDFDPTGLRMYKMGYRNNRPCLRPNAVPHIFDPAATNRTMPYAREVVSTSPELRLLTSTVTMSASTSSATCTTRPSAVTSQLAQSTKSTTSRTGIRRSMRLKALTSKRLKALTSKRRSPKSKLKTRPSAASTSGRSVKSLSRASPSASSSSASRKPTKSRSKSSSVPSCTGAMGSPLASSNSTTMTSTTARSELQQDTKPDVCCNTSVAVVSSVAKESTSVPSSSSAIRPSTTAPLPAAEQHAILTNGARIKLTPAPHTSTSAPPMSGASTPAFVMVSTSTEGMISVAPLMAATTSTAKTSTIPKSVQRQLATYAMVIDVASSNVFHNTPPAAFVEVPLTVDPGAGKWKVRVGNPPYQKSRKVPVGRAKEFLDQSKGVQCSVKDKEQSEKMNDVAMDEGAEDEESWTVMTVSSDTKDNYDDGGDDDDRSSLYLSSSSSSSSSYSSSSSNSSSPSVSCSQSPQRQTVSPSSSSSFGFEVLPERRAKVTTLVNMMDRMTKVKGHKEKTGNDDDDHDSDEDSDVEDEDDVADDNNDDESPPAFCLCKSTDYSQFIISCDYCAKMYHGKCVGVEEMAAKFILKYACPPCRDENPDLTVVFKDSVADSEASAPVEHEDRTEENVAQHSKTTSTVVELDPVGIKKFSKDYEKRNPPNKKRRTMFCGQCIACLRNSDCGQCVNCLDKPKFGGEGKKRQKCLKRKCLVFPTHLEREKGIKVEHKLNRLVAVTMNERGEVNWEAIVSDKKVRSSVRQEAALIKERGDPPMAKKKKSGKRCMVYNCGNDAYHGFITHKMPGKMPKSEEDFTEIQKDWIAFIGRRRKFNTHVALKYAKIIVCSEHFLNVDYVEEDVKLFELGLRTTPPSLKADAVPSLDKAKHPFNPYGSAQPSFKRKSKNFTRLASGCKMWKSGKRKIIPYQTIRYDKSKIPDDRLRKKISHELKYHHDYAARPTYAGTTFIDLSEEDEHAEMEAACKDFLKERTELADEDVAEGTRTGRDVENNDDVETESATEELQEEGNSAMQITPGLMEYFDKHSEKRSKKTQALEQEHLPQEAKNEDKHSSPTDSSSDESLDILCVTLSPKEEEPLREREGPRIRQRRRRPCGHCEPCQIKGDCRQCNFCKDMKKYGGKGIMKQKCALRWCLNYRVKRPRYQMSPEFRYSKPRHPVDKQQGTQEGCGKCVACRTSINCRNCKNCWLREARLHGKDKKKEFKHQCIFRKCLLKKYDPKKSQEAPLSSPVDPPPSKPLKRGPLFFACGACVSCSRLEDCGKCYACKLNRKNEGTPSMCYAKRCLNKRLKMLSLYKQEKAQETEDLANPDTNGKDIGDEGTLASSTSRILEAFPDQIKKWKRDPEFSEEKGIDWEKLESSLEEIKNNLASIDEKMTKLKEITSKPRSFVIMNIYEKPIKPTSKCLSRGPQILGESQLADYLDEKQSRSELKVRMVYHGGAQDSKVALRDFCGCPLELDILTDTDKFCTLYKTNCQEHYNWEKLKQAELDLERVKWLVKLDGLLDVGKSS
nr:uncharacterized protein LOC129257776 isoform X1 [Lytechinus pictus]